MARINEKAIKYKNTTEKYAAWESNEKEILKCFAKVPAFNGIDKITINVPIKYVKYDELERYRAHNNSCKFTPTEHCTNLSFNVYDSYNSINITDKNFGKLIVAHGNNPPYTHIAKLTLIHGGLNVETTDVQGIWGRYANACKYLADRGIFIDESIPPTIDTLELSITFACDKILPLRVRKYIINAFAEGHYAATPKRYHATSTPHDEHIIYSSKYLNQKIVLYDKTAKAEHLNMISKGPHEIRVYRLEFELNKKLIKNNEILDSTLLSDLSDIKIKSYLLSRINAAIDYYAHTISKNSISALKKHLKEGTKNHKKDPSNKTSVSTIESASTLISSEMDKTDYSDCIDAESLVYLPMKGIITNLSNSAATKKRYIDHLSKLVDNPITKMLGWETERVFVLLRNSIDNTCEMVSPSPKYYIVANGKYTNAIDYLNTQIGIHKRYVHPTYESTIKERIESKWSNPAFELNILDDNPVLI